MSLEGLPALNTILQSLESRLDRFEAEVINRLDAGDHDVILLQERVAELTMLLYESECRLDRLEDR